MIIIKKLFILIAFVILAVSLAKTVSASTGCHWDWQGWHWVWVCPPSPTASPVPTLVPTPEPTLEPTATPSATLVPEEVVVDHGAPFNYGGTWCDGIAPATIEHAFATRIGSNTLVAYWPTVVGGQVNVRFREVGQTEWKHALRDFPNFGLAPIGFLKEGIKYDYQMTNGNGCNQSAWSKVFAGL